MGFALGGRHPWEFRNAPSISFPSVKTLAGDLRCVRSAPVSAVEKGGAEGGTLRRPDERGVVVQNDSYRYLLQ